MTTKAEENQNGGNMKNLYIDGLELPETKKRDHYIPTILEAYIVICDENKIIQAKDTNRFFKRNIINLTDYINDIYMQTTRRGYKSGTHTAGYVSYDGNYLIIVENGPTLKNSIRKMVFDVKNVEFPKETVKQLEELQEYSKYSFDENLVSRYSQILLSIANNRIAPIIKQPYQKSEELFGLYKESENELAPIININAIGTPLPAAALFFIAYNNITKMNAIFTGIYYAQSLILSEMVTTNYQKGKCADNTTKRLNDYRELCDSLIHGNIDAIETLTDKINEITRENGIYKNGFYFKASKDMMILNCYNDKSLTEIKVDLLSLICEYIQYISLKKYDIIDKIFADKLKEIEDKINLSSLRPSCDYDEEAMDFLSLYCESIDNNRFGKLIPVEYDPKKTYEEMQAMQIEETPKIKVK